MLIILMETLSPRSRRLLLEKGTTITLRNGQMTVGRRTNLVPQLKCVGESSSCSGNLPQVVQCQIVGFGKRAAKWRCQYNADRRFVARKVLVTCEGYDYPDDPYILEGSCKLEYIIEYSQG